jgi:long-subunit acyl-CoA synthetase (AMP-forming)
MSSAFAYHVPTQVHKGGLVKKLVFDYAYWRKLWFMRHGWRYDQASCVQHLALLAQHAVVHTVCAQLTSLGAHLWASLVQASKISDAVVFNKIKQKLGGRVRVILTGGAPISAHVEEFLRVTMCAPLVQVGTNTSSQDCVDLDPWMPSS